MRSGDLILWQFLKRQGAGEEKHKIKIAVVRLLRSRLGGPRSRCFRYKSETIREAQGRSPEDKGGHGQKDRLCVPGSNQHFQRAFMPQCGQLRSTDVCGFGSSGPPPQRIEDDNERRAIRAAAHGPVCEAHPAGRATDRNLGHGVFTVKPSPCGNTFAIIPAPFRVESDFPLRCLSICRRRASLPCSDVPHLRR